MSLAMFPVHRVRHKQDPGSPAAADARLLPVSGILRALLPGLVLLLAAGTAAAQKATPDPHPEDPFSGGEPELLAHSGIELVGPFLLADDHWTRDVDQELGEGVRIRWVETRHFKLGIGLKDRPLPTEKAERDALLDEVKEMGRTIPRFKRRPRAVDSWMLVHLYARRLERIYAEFCQRVGFADAAPAVTGGASIDGRGWRDRGGLGVGPYLGQHGKYVVLILEQRGEIERYLRRFAGRNMDQPTSHHYLDSNTLVYLTTPDARWEALKTERGLHCNVVYGVVRNLTDGVGGYTYDLPAWVGEGLGHWFRRRVDPKYDSFCSLDPAQIDLIHGVDWREKTRARVDVDIWERAEALMAWQDHEAAEFQKHVMMWSRMDYLLTERPDDFPKFLRVLKSLPTTGVPYQRVLEHQVVALQEAFAMDQDEFDRRWCQWVQKRYPRPAAR